MQHLSRRFEFVTVNALVAQGRTTEWIARTLGVTRYFVQTYRNLAKQPVETQERYLTHDGRFPNR